MLLKAFTIAWRNVIRHRRRSIATLTAMIVGIGTVISVRGLMNSTQQAERNTVIQGRYGALQIFARDYRSVMKTRPLSKTFEDSDDLRRRIKSVAGVTGVAPRLAFTGVLRQVHGEDVHYVTVLAIDPASERTVSPKLFEWVTSGSFFVDRNSEELLTTDPKTGDVGTRHFILPLGVQAGKAPVSLSLTGRISKALPGENDVAIVPLSVIQKQLSMENRVTSLAVAIDHEARLAEIKDALRKTLGDQYEVSGWQELFPFIDDLQRVGRSFFDIVTLIFLGILLVAVANTLLSRVMERRAEIGTMLATGIPETFVALVFTLEGVLLATVGAIMGAAAGIAGVAIMHAVGVPFTLPGGEASFVLKPVIFPEQIGRVIMWTSAGSIVASLWPAHRASRLQPIEAMRVAA